jgi:hypothetical protein
VPYQYIAGPWLERPAEYQDAADRGARRRGGRVAEETYDRVGGQQ